MEAALVIVTLFCASSSLSSSLYGAKIARPPAPTAKATNPPEEKPSPTTVATKSPSKGTCSGTTTGRGNPITNPAKCPSWIAKSPVEPDTANSVKKLQGARAVDVLFDGDSIAAQLGVDGNGALAAYLPGVSTMVAAVPGDTTGYMVHRWCQTDAFPEAKVFVIGIGTNDLALEPSAIAERHETIRDLIRSKRPKSSIIFTALWWRNSMVERVDATNELTKKLVERSDPKVFYAPHTRLAANDTTGFLDGLHPNPASWNRALEGLAPCILHALSKAA